MSRPATGQLEADGLRVVTEAQTPDDLMRQMSDIAKDVKEVSRALADGGVDVVEITMSVPNALDVLRQVRAALGDRLLLGAGTVLDSETARAVLLAGAEYIVAPTLNLDVWYPLRPDYAKFTQYQTDRFSADAAGV